MDKRNKIQNYVNNFRNNISSYLKSGVGIESKIYPSKKEGAIIEFYIGKNNKNTDKYTETYNSVNEAIRYVKQSSFGGNVEAFDFSGTNYILEGNRIIIVKGSDRNKYWSKNAAKKDVKKILNKGVSKI